MRTMVNKTALLDQVYTRIGVTKVDRTDLRPPMTDGSLYDSNNHVRYFCESIMTHTTMLKYLTVTVDLPVYEDQGQDRWGRSPAHWQVCGYLNKKGNGLSALIICNLQVLQDLVHKHIGLVE